MHNVDRIEEFHAHIYFATPAEREHAMEMRDEIGRSFSDATLGRVHDKEIGPHLQPMYQVAFSSEEFARFVPWLMLNRGELSVLVHPLIGDPLPEHTDHAAWLGKRLDLHLEAFAAIS